MPTQGGDTGLPLKVSEEVDYCRLVISSRQPTRMYGFRVNGKPNLTNATFA